MLIIGTHTLRATKYYRTKVDYSAWFIGPNAFLNRIQSILNIIKTITVFNLYPICNPNPNPNPTLTLTNLINSDFSVTYCKNCMNFVLNVPP
jgi:hypothetical protein